MPVIVGISGPSCSGKSTVATAVASIMPSSLVIQQDWYFVDTECCPPETNFCDLRWLDVVRLVADVQTLMARRPADVPVIDFVSFRRIGNRTLPPQDTIIVEGMTIFRIPELAACFDLKFYIEADLATLMTRKLERDRVERKKSPSAIDAQLRWMQEEYRKDEALRRQPDLELLAGDTSAQDLAHRIKRTLLSLER